MCAPAFLGIRRVRRVPCRWVAVTYRAVSLWIGGDCRRASGIGVSRLPLAGTASRQLCRGMSPQRAESLSAAGRRLGSPLGANTSPHLTKAA